MAYTPLYTGETHKPLSLTWTDDSGTALDLTGAAVTVRFAGVAGSTSFNGSGSVTITSATAGKFTYSFSSADVATAGNWRLQFRANYSAGNDQYSDPIPLEILPAL